MVHPQHRQLQCSRKERYPHFLVRNWVYTWDPCPIHHFAFRYTNDFRISSEAESWTGTHNSLGSFYRPASPHRNEYLLAVGDWMLSSHNVIVSQFLFAEVFGRDNCDISIMDIRSYSFDSFLYLLLFTKFRSHRIAFAIELILDRNFLIMLFHC